MLDGSSNQSTIRPDLNTGMMVDDSTGQFVGGPGEVGTAAAELVTFIQAWFVPIVVGLVVLLILKR
jgi:hypothetical protein